MNDKINTKPITYEDWLDLGHVIIPTDQKKARVSWKKEDFSLTKEEWKNNHAKAQIALRLDKHIDLDIVITFGQVLVNLHNTYYQKVLKRTLKSFLTEQLFVN